MEQTNTNPQKKKKYKKVCLIMCNGHETISSIKRIGSNLLWKWLEPKVLEIQRIGLNNGLEVSYKIIFKKERLAHQMFLFKSRMEQH